MLWPKCWHDTNDGYKNEWKNNGMTCFKFAKKLSTEYLLLKSERSNLNGAPTQRFIRNLPLNLLFFNSSKINNNLTISSCASSRLYKEVTYSHQNNLKLARDTFKWHLSMNYNHTKLHSCLELAGLLYAGANLFIIYLIFHSPSKLNKIIIKGFS
jgi:hypothetical protein